MDGPFGAVKPALHISQLQAVSFADQWDGVLVLHESVGGVVDGAQHADDVFGLLFQNFIRGGNDEAGPWREELTDATQLARIDVWFGRVFFPIKNIRLQFFERSEGTFQIFYDHKLLLQNPLVFARSIHNGHEVRARAEATDGVFFIKNMLVVVQRIVEGRVHAPDERRDDVVADDFARIAPDDVGDDALREQDAAIDFAVTQGLGHLPSAAFESRPFDVDAPFGKFAPLLGKMDGQVEMLGYAADSDDVVFHFEKIVRFKATMSVLFFIRKNIQV